MGMTAICRLAGAGLLVLWLLPGISCAPEKEAEPPDVFIIEHELILPGSPETVYDAATGDISGWWDHTYSEKPARFYLEPKPGGGFYEIFGESGDGVLHATVTFAHRGKLLRFEGPLGLSGRAVKMVHTYAFEPAGGDSTRMKLSVHIAGECDADVAKTVDYVWRHFLFERFKPYVESGRKTGTTP